MNSLNAESIRRENEKFSFWMRRASAAGALIFLSLSLLDMVVYPELAPLFFLYRVVIASFLAAVSAVVPKLRDLRQSHALGFVAVTASACAVEAMILKTGGPSSPYYVGMILLAACVAVYVQADMNFHVPAALLIYAVYAGPIIFTRPIEDWRTFFLSNFFMTAFMVSMLTARYMMLSIGRRRDSEISDAENSLVLSEQRLKLAQQTAHVGNWEWDTATNEVFWSDELFRIYGYEPGEIKPDYGLVVESLTPESRPEFLASIEAAFKNGSPFEMDYAFLKKDGSRAVLHTIGRVLRDDYGRPAGMSGIVQDITARKLAEEELQRYREHLEALVTKRTEEAVGAARMASIGELAAGVAHEINNPINGIINYAQMISDGLPKDSAHRDTAARIMKEGTRIARIVHSLLSFGREKKNKREEIGISGVIEECLVLTGTQLHRDGIDLLLKIPPNLPRITADFQQIQQVCLNVISNARHALNVKYTAPSDDKKLEISAELIRKNDSDFIRLAFTDTGVGIPSNIIDRVTSPFFTTKPTGVGTGLGLSLSLGIIEAHGGSLNVRSEEGKYTKITVELPAAKPEAG